MVLSETSTTDGEASQASEAVGAVNTGEAGHEMVASAPAEEIEGAVLSTTVMVWETVEDSLPLHSTAFQVLVLE